MKRFLLLAILALALFATVPANAECGGFGSIQVCEDTSEDWICSYGYLAVTNSYMCAYIDDGNFNYFWFEVYGEQHNVYANGTTHGLGVGIHVASAGFCGYLNDSPDFGGGTC